MRVQIKDVVEIGASDETQDFSFCDLRGRCERYLSYDEGKGKVFVCVFDFHLSVGVWRLDDMWLEDKDF